MGGNPMRVGTVLAGLALATALVVMTAAAEAAPQVSVVASGLDSPRGVALSRGDVLVGEAGHGGDVCIPNPIFGTNCIGLSSQISTVNPRTGAHHPIIAGLFSSLLGGSEALGVDGISARGNQILAILAEYPQ